MMELLAPAGDFDALVAAVRGGADAVYLGLTELNARRGAGNFAPEALVRAADYCHERAVRVYATVNTLVKQSEMGALESVARQLARAGVDAAIVQDLGAASALSKMLPGIELHASTQMAIHNRSGVRFLKSRGFGRVVLAREMTFSEIADCMGEGVELEVFGHGALCVSCSGQCLFSSMVGGRSGNRGLCAQPCRLAYRLVGEGVDISGERLSPKDLMTIHHLSELRRAGAKSLKLEGRLKGPDYVYAVTSAYRRALDGGPVDDAPLRQVFNRGYTPGYGPGVVDSALLCDPNEQHVQKRSGAWPHAPERRISLTGALMAQVGEPLGLTLSDGTSTAECAGESVPRATGRPFDRARARAQIEKLGDSPYRLQSLEISADDDAFVRVGELNALRRAATEQLGVLRAARYRGIPDAVHPLPAARAHPEIKRAKPRLSVCAADAAVLNRAKALGADEVLWSPMDVTDEGLERAPDTPFALLPPPTLSEVDLTRLNRWANAHGRITATVLSNAAHFALSWPGDVRADAMMNAANDYAADALGGRYAPSLELTAQEIRRLPGDVELIVYGKVALMQLRHCPLNAALGGKSHAACRRCDGGKHPQLSGCGLIDRMRVSFPLERLRTSSGCIVRVMNSVPLMLLRHTKKLPDARIWRVLLTDEPDGLKDAVVRLHRAAIDGIDVREAPDWAALDAEKSTTGHYFRGVN